MTLPHVTAGLLIIAGLFRISQITRPLVLAITAMAGMLVWGVLVALPTSETPRQYERVLNHSCLFVFSGCVLAFAGLTRFQRDDFRCFLPSVKWVYAVVVLYAVYQTFGRRYGWPYSFLDVNNRSLSTDAILEGYQPGASQLGTESTYASRASSFFVEPTNLGMYLGYGAAVSFGLIERGDRWAREGYRGLLLTGIGFAANQSLTGLLAIGVVVGINLVRLLLIRRVTRFRLILSLLVITFLGLLLVPGAFEAIRDRVLGLSIDDSSGRFTALPMVMDVFTRQPLGLGIGNHGLLFESIHNGLLLFLVQFGVLAFLVPACWIHRMCTSFLSSVRSRQATDEGWRYVFTMSLLAVHFCTWASSGLMYEPINWCLSGFAFALYGNAPSATRPIPSANNG